MRVELMLLFQTQADCALFYSLVKMKDWFGNSHLDWCAAWLDR